LKVEYSDYAVGRNLQVTVQDWVKGLPNRKVNKVIKWLEARSDFMTAFVPYAFGAASLYGLSKISHPNVTSQAVSQLMACLSIALVMYVVGRILNVQLFQQIQAGKPLTFIQITSGDNARCLKMKAKHSRRLWVAGFLGITIVAGMIVNLCSSYVFDWLKG